MIKRIICSLVAAAACITPSAALAEDAESATQYVRGARVETAWTDQGTHGPILVVVERRNYHTSYAGHCMGRGSWDWVSYGDTELSDEFASWVDDYFEGFC